MLKFKKLKKINQKNLTNPDIYYIYIKLIAMYFDVFIKFDSNYIYSSFC